MTNAIPQPRAANPVEAVVRSPDTPDRFRQRYNLLDPIRGLAAIVVVIHHAFGQPAYGHQAVMVFFVISGYCMSAALSSAIKHKLSVYTFIQRRIRRIYPPYALSLAFYTVTRLAKLLLTGVNDLQGNPIAWIQNITLTQWTWLICNPVDNYVSSNPRLFVSAYWSLNYEEQFYILITILFLAAATRFPTKILMTSAVAGIAYILIARTKFHGTFLDYYGVFSIGILVFLRLCVLQSRVARHSIDAGLVLLLLAVAFADSQYDATGFRVELISSLLTGLFLIVARPYDQYICDNVVVRLLSLIGIISYSLYLIHQFNLVSVSSLANLVAPRESASHVFFVLAGHVALAAVFWRFCEKPFLNAPLSKE